MSNAESIEEATSLLLITMFLLDFVLGALFITAFYFKTNSYRNFELSIQSYRAIPIRLIRVAAIGLLMFELLLFVAFASGTALYFKEIGAIMLLIAFSVLIVRKRRIESESGGSCSCFGSIGFLNRYPLSRNALLIGLCAAKCFIPVTALSAHNTYRQFIIYSIVICSCLFILDYVQTRRRVAALQVYG